MRLVEVFRTPGATTVADLRRQLAGRGLSDHLWLDLVGGGDPGFVAVRVAAEGERMLAYAQVSAASGGAELEVLGDDPAAVRDAAATALDAFAADGGGELTWWVDDPSTEVRDLAAGVGLAPLRALHEMRRPLPHERHADIATRAFRPGTADEDAWLAVNNRAFAGHPEQGGWTRATLASRIAADWFDADGFRLHEVDGALLGFCWTKVHPATDREPELGEIYVIAADPETAPRGLGTQLTLAGLDWLSARGIATADLYVDAANASAMALYERLGFGVHRTRTAFHGHVAPDRPPAAASTPEGTR